MYLIDSSITEIYFTDNLNDPSFETNYLGTIYKAEDLIALLLKNIISDVEMDLGEKIDEAVITVPVSSDWHYQNALMHVAKKVGLKILGLINESTAIVLAYSWGEARIFVIASSGDNELGGQD